VKMDLIVPRPTTSSSAAATVAPAPATTTGAEDRSTAFRPVQAGNEMQSGEKLLVEAYAAIWVILFAMVLLSWRRQRHLDDRMSTLEAAIDKARASSEADSKKAGP
jgi:CcmD family protein